MPETTKEQAAALVIELEALILRGLTYGQACETFGRIQDRDEPHLEAFRGAVDCNDELEVDPGAIVSQGDDGAFVHAWVYVTNEQAGVDPVDEEGEEEEEGAADGNP